MAGKDENADLGPFGCFGTHKKRFFLEAFVECGGILNAADAVGIHVNSHYYWMKTDPAYPEMFALADQMATATLENVAFKRAKDASDTLLIFLLKARNRDKYGDKQQISFDKETDQEMLERARKSVGLRSLVTEGVGQTRPAERN